MTTLLPGAAAPEICRSWLQAGIGVLVQSTLLLALGLLAGRMLSSRGPALQSLVYRATLGAVAISALASLLLAGSFPALWSVSLPPEHRTELGQPMAKAPAAMLRAAETTRPLAAETSALRALERPNRLPSAPASSSGERRAGGLGWVYVGMVGAWFGGSALLLAWLCLCHLHIRRLRQSSVPVRDGEAAALLPVLCSAFRILPPLLLANARVQSPFLTGPWRPAILLPAAYELEFDGPALRAILIHELTHVARWDCAWNLLVQTLCAVLWVQPLVWALSRRLEHAGEEVCDQKVLELEDNPHAYADTLLRLAERLMPSRPERAAGMGVVPFRSSLARRVEQILDGSRRQTLALAWRWRVAIALGAACAVAMGLSLVSAAATRPGSSRKASRQINAAEKPAGGPVSGRVVTPDGKPVSGATVSWVGDTDDGTVLQASVQTDAAGQFRLEHTERLRHKDDRPQLLVEAAGWGLASQSIPAGHEPVEISLIPPTELQVTFVDQDGKPVPDLDVFPRGLFKESRSFLQSFFRFPAHTAARFTRRTDARGAVTFPYLPRGYRVQFDTEDERFARLETENFLLSQGPVTELPPIHLVPGASVRGRVTFGPSGKPAAGIKVGAQGMSGERGWGDAVSDANGEYRMTQLRPGAYNIALDIKGEMARTWTARAHEAVYVHPGERVEALNFELISGAVLTGRATAEDTGEPIPGVDIGVYGPAHPQSGAWVQGMTTRADGTFLHRVPGGKQHLYIMMAVPPPGFAMPAQTSRDLTVRDGETVTVDFKLPRGTRVRPVRGRVLDPDGRPVAYSEVVVSSSGRFAMDTTLRADADGRFLLNEQLLSNTVTLRARRGDLATPTGTVVAGGGPVTLRLQRNVLASLSGRVTDTAGRPIAGAQITFIAWAYDSGNGCVPASVAGGTDQEGRYTLPSLWSDLHYSVDATAKGFGHKGSDRIDLKPAESAELPPLVLKVADRSVAGRVVDEAGDPIVGAQVSLSGRDSAQQVQAADGEGTFRFDAVVDEKITLQSYSLGYQWARKSVPAGTTDVILVLAKEKDSTSSDAGSGVKEQFDALMGQPAPALHAVAWINSPPRTMGQLRGKVVLIDFWGIGCGPCVASLPGVQRAAEQFAGRGVVVIGLHAAGTSTAELGKFAQQHHLTYPLAIDAPDAQNLSFGKTFRQYTVVGIPSVAVIDRSGKVAYVGHSLDEAIGSLGPLLARA